MTRRSLRRPLPHALTAALAITLVTNPGITPANATTATEIPLLNDYDAESLANIPDVGGLEYLAQRYAPTDTCPPTGTGPGGPLFGGNDKPPQFRQGVPLPGQKVVKIVIMGDSYMSGEGAGDYFNKRGFLPEPPIPNRVGGPFIPAPGHTEADYNEDFRHRSANAAVLQGIDLLRRANPEVFFDIRFNASSGASSEHFFVGQNDHGRVNPPQNQGLDDATNLVISGFGGNDVDFGPMLTALLKKTGNVSAIEAEIAPLFNTTRTSEQEWADSEPPRPPFVRPLTQPTTLSARLVQLVRATKTATGGKARIMMVNYPQSLAESLPPGGLMGWLVKRYHHESDWAKLRALTPRLTASIKKAQQVLADHGIAADLLDIENAFAGHELGSKTPYTRNLNWKPAPGGDSFNQTQQSGHPNQQGQKALAGHYALMIAGELGLRVKAPDGARPPAKAAQPCDAGRSDRHSLPATATHSGGSTGGTGGGGGGGSSVPNVGPRSTMTFVNIDPPLSQPNPGSQPKPTPTGSNSSPGTPDPTTPRWNIYPVDTIQPTTPTVSFDLTQPLPYLWPRPSAGGSPYRDVYEVKINADQLIR
ncbi:hypothetical protein ACFQ08_22130 [Streptosporangium algeriense]|uniref:SGNH hydrolase-type esterase domain-containing protein n=1 Tax=Streptosporangium algeriense TaxID=1682748 RepID=A0ABW3DTR0_9ACTN